MPVARKVWQQVEEGSPAATGCLHCVALSVFFRLLD